MKDQFGREISYLRISVTDRCNFRCKYCMGEDGIKLLRHEDILTFEEIVETAQIMAGLGIKKIRFTGGEPFARRGVMDLIKKLSEIPEIEDLAITTNGSMVYDKLDLLKEYGISRINFSLDTLDREKFELITGSDQLEEVKRTIKKAIELDFKVKVNVVLIKGFNDKEIGDFLALTENNDIEVRFIELMPIGADLDFDRNNYKANDNILDGYRKKDLGFDGVARSFAIEGHKGRVGLISPLSHKFCKDCNRIRLTADGKLKACLHSREEISIKGLSLEEKKKIIRESIYTKPKSHRIGDFGSESARTMSSIGG